MAVHATATILPGKNQFVAQYSMVTSSYESFKESSHQSFKGLTLETG